ncbi:hypothetical protein AB0I27_18790 [Streptomyces sp. NPDC050597]|uniref:hypothetical protein n=1 Tax=Streptomyces sp. NPDC050597 TaxID=3157212 RepID=UPI003435D41E
MADSTATRAGALVLCGITGDLSRKMLLPALYQLVRQGALTERRRPSCGIAVSPGVSGVRPRRWKGPAEPGVLE